ncbi:MAG: serpin family protein [Bacillota bacterium]|jgi:serine protease inhibitor
MRKVLFVLLTLTLLSGCTQATLPPNMSLLSELAEQGAGVGLYQQFGFDLYHQLNSGSLENLLISPTSIALAVSMTLNGADGGTRQQMLEALGLGDCDLQQLNEANQLLIRRLQDSDVTLSIANSLWMRQGIEFNQDFVQSNQTYYDAAAHNLDFSSDAAVETINNWVKEQTNDLIDGIIEGPIHPLTLMFLINAIYFQGDWGMPFDPDRTKEGLFHTPQGTVNVPFMRQTDKFDYLYQDGLQALRLPYADEELAMYLFLPEDWEAFQQQLTAEQWQGWLGDFRSERVQLELPKFEFAYEEQLNDALQALGMTLPFAAGQADFHLIADIEQDIYISEVKHKSFIAVDEVGTEAAAVTSVEMVATGMPVEPIQLKFDRPFFFVIHDRMTDTALFMGQVMDPARTE